MTGAVCASARLEPDQAMQEFSLTNEPGLKIFGPWSRHAGLEKSTLCRALVWIMVWCSQFSVSPLCHRPLINALNSVRYGYFFSKDGKVEHHCKDCWTLWLHLLLAALCHFYKDCHCLLSKRQSLFDQFFFFIHGHAFCSACWTSD